MATHGSSPQHSSLARWAVGLAAGATIAMGVAVGTVASVSVSDSPDALDDNAAGWVVVGLLFGGLATSLVAFVMAGVCRVKHEGWQWLWLPLAAFPAMLTFLILGEAFWWE